MNSTVLTAASSQPNARSRYADFVEMTKPRLAVLVLFSVAAAGFAAAGQSAGVWLIVHAVLATGMIAASANVANQLLEIRSDARMQRTANRALPTGRVSVAEATWFMVLAGLSGVTYLAVAVGWRPAMLGAATWCLYVAVYTPLKQRTSWNTTIGAIPGAMPILIGWSATGVPMNDRCWTLFLLLFFWQFPHFMAIAWKYRDDYRAGGMKMLTVTDPTGLRAALVAVAMSIGLLLISLLPAVTSFSTPYVSTALLLGLGLLLLAGRFLIQRDDRSARYLLRASLVYLPLMLIALTFLPNP